MQRLFFRGGHASAPKIVSFSGIARDDRSSWICARAAEYLASQGDTSVCLVDANFSSPRLHNHYDIANRSGLAAALTTDGPIRAFATQLPIKNLWLMPSGSAKPELEANMAHCRARFAELREEFGHVLVSAPPLARESEATLMGQLADGIVLIVEANQSRRDSIRQVKEQLETAQVQCSVQCWTNGHFLFQSFCTGGSNRSGSLPPPPPPPIPVESSIAEIGAEMISTPNQAHAVVDRSLPT